MHKQTTSQSSTMMSSKDIFMDYFRKLRRQAKTNAAKQTLPALQSDKQSTDWNAVYDKIAATYKETNWQTVFDKSAIRLSIDAINLTETYE